MKSITNKKVIYEKILKKISMKNNKNSKTRKNVILYLILEYLM